MADFRVAKVMKEKQARDPAGRALPCPFCGEQLIAKNDHHGWWVADRDDSGPRFDPMLPDVEGENQ